MQEARLKDVLKKEINTAGTDTIVGAITLSECQGDCTGDHCPQGQ